VAAKTDTTLLRTFISAVIGPYISAFPLHPARLPEATVGSSAGPREISFPLAKAATELAVISPTPRDQLSLALKLPLVVFTIILRTIKNI
jgi:hypothetical protein